MINQRKGILWVAFVVLGLSLLFSWVLYAEYVWLLALVGVPFVAVFGALINDYRQNISTRTAAYTVYSTLVVLMIVAIVGVLNFLISKHPFKVDLTKNKIHTFSDQSVKLIKGLNKPVKAVLYGKMKEREETRPLLENYKSLNDKFEIEFVDPDREPTRAKQVGIKKYGTLQLIVGAKDTKVEEINEEKVTNALIKLLKEKTTTLCSVTGHGEKSLDSNQADGYEAAKKALVSQAYEVKTINLVQEAKIPESCDAIAILGPTSSLFDPEIKLIKDYLANGGRAVIAVDLNVKGKEFSPELSSVLESWYVKPASALIVDPMSRMFGVDASVAVVFTFSRDNAITRDFQQIQCPFPLARPLEIMPGAPAGLTVQWIAQTNPKSFAVGDLKAVASGKVQFNPQTDKTGPLNVGIAVDGKQKDSKASRNTRMVVFGSSHFATNNYSRFGGNLDFFMNAVSWLMEDESMISIRAKEEGPGKVELSQKSGMAIFLLTVLVVPILIAAAGITIWAIRRKL